MRFIVLCFFLAASSLMMASAQEDGNPHNWDRQRRCDPGFYDQPCQLCEGIGGIPWGDDNKDIKITSCTPIAHASEIKDAPHPVWTESWQAQVFEILIGAKTDPFCFAAFPSNSSAGPLCYKPDYGVQYYDMAQSKALHFDINSKTPVGNVTSNIYHQGTNFWVVNKLPWYAAGVHQCVCTHVFQGSDSNTAPAYPVNPTWTQKMHLLGQEKIGIEWTGEEMVLNHWSYGPHHVWAHPVSGQIYRMYQPFNGLQVFPNGITVGPQDQSQFQLPPPECKKGGSLFRVKCDDDGYPIDEQQPTAAAAAPTVAEEGASEACPVGQATVADMKRAHQKIPGEDFRGHDFAHMSEVLNGWLEKAPVATKACDEWSSKELHELQALLYMLRDVELDEVYQSAKDNRRLRDSLDNLGADWASLSEEVNANFGDDPAHITHTMLRDGKCHEAVMWYVHQLSEDTKAVLAESDVVIPLLSKSLHHAPDPSNASSTEHKVYGVYQDQVTCASCHSSY